MKNLQELKNKFSFKITLFGLMLICTCNQVFAEGSKDLYPDGASGYRASLRSSLTIDTERWMFPTQGTHYVYAKANEIITLASSAVGAGSGAIRLYSPSGALIAVPATNPVSGIIASRTQEKNGPKLTAAATIGGYVPQYYTVPTNGAGIYRVEFISRGTTLPSTTFNANEDWTQGAADITIHAWDVSVINLARTNFITGRVYSNILNLSNGTGSPNTNGFRGVVYGLTDDGFIYKVNNNGNNGMYFSFFINNNGFIAASVSPSTDRIPLYKSLNKTSINGDVHSPISADETTKQVTHKMFYALPNVDLPQTSIGAVPGNATWLRKTPIVPVVTNPRFQGVEGTQGQISSKGGYVKFSSNRPAKYTIVIKSSASPATFSQKILLGFANENENSVFWDGKDGAGVTIPEGTNAAEITVQLQGAEVHFPYIDMEYNREGTIIQLLDKDNLPAVASSLVYWNDTDIPDVTNGSNSNPKNSTHLPPLNSSGINSIENGHKWGIAGTGTGGQFGDVKSMDTWAFVRGPVETLSLSFITRFADLKISQVTADKTKIVPGDLLTVYVKAKNDGPSNVTGSKFTFTLPIGFTPQSATFTGSGCGSESVAMNYDSATRTYSSNLDLPNLCEVGYTFKMAVNNNVIGENQNFKATILRPNDVTDPDATDPDPATLPTNAQTECTNNGKGGICNNIRSINISYTTAAVCTEQVSGQNFDVTTPSAANGNNSNVITFTQPATNNGFVFDITYLDNSFNMTINGTNLATSEIEFQSGTNNPGINIRFADGTLYGPTLQIYSVNGTLAAPAIRVIISNTGVISMFGSKTSGGPLFPLELFNGNSFNTISWNSAGNNTVRISQAIYNATRISGRGYGQNVIPCACYDLPNTSAAGVATKHGITLLNRAGAANGNWPMNRNGGHTALESNTKGFVITRASSTQITAIETPVDGMMVYDTVAKCLKIYTVDLAVPENTGWKCFSTPACP